jgi:hypothetical protein
MSEPGFEAFTSPSVHDPNPSGASQPPFICNFPVVLILEEAHLLGSPREVGRMAA